MEFASDFAYFGQGFKKEGFDSIGEGKPASVGSDIWQVRLGKKWTNLSPAIAKKIKEVHKKGGTECIVEERGFKYRIDLNKKEQYNLKTKKSRQLRTRTPTPLRVDANICKVSMGILSEPAEVVHAGSPLTCIGCTACFSGTSVLVQNDTVWTCEYCQQENTRDYSNIPDDKFEILRTAKSVDYDLDSKQGEMLFFENGATKEKSESLTIFCIDTSGSMTITSENMIEGQYVTRLELTANTVMDQLNSLRQQNPNNHVGLVTFSNQVNVIGDGTTSIVSFKGHVLYNYDDLVKKASALDKVKVPVSACRDKLMKRLLQMKTKGQTALGPALLTSIVMAGKRPGSHVICCTDGLSNVGIGALDEKSTSQEKFRASSMYRRLAKYAAKQGVKVSVISIKGEHCNLRDLGALSERTGGTVHQCDPTELNSIVGGLTAKQSTASNVDVRMVMHTSMAPYRNGVLTDNNNSNVDIKSAASVSDTTELHFQYGPRPQELQAKLSIPPSNPLRVPFQVQIRYIQNGKKRMRVFVGDQPVTENWNHALQHLRLIILTTFGTRCSMEMALAGEFKRADEFGKLNKEFLQQAAVISRPKSGVLTECFEFYTNALDVVGGLVAKAEDPMYEDVVQFQGSPGQGGNRDVMPNVGDDDNDDDGDGSDYRDVMPNPHNSSNTNNTHNNYDDDDDGDAGYRDVVPNALDDDDDDDDDDAGYRDVSPTASSARNRRSSYNFSGNMLLINDDSAQQMFQMLNWDTSNFSSSESNTDELPPIPTNTTTTTTLATAPSVDSGVYGFSKSSAGKKLQQTHVVVEDLYATNFGDDFEEDGADDV